jgi:hypothetical protein
MPPPPPPPTTPPLPRGYVQIGAYEFGVGAVGPTSQCVVTIKPTSKGKVDEKNAQGKDDAKTTWQGKEPADLEIEIQWNSARDDVDQAIEEQLFQLSPRGPNGGQTQTIAGRRLRVHATTTILVKEMEGPEDKPGTTLVSCKMKVASISAQAQTQQTGQGDAKTPTSPTKSDGSQSSSTAQPWSVPKDVNGPGGTIPPTVTP